MPGGAGLGQPETAAESTAHGGRRIPERRQGARGAGQLSDQQARPAGRQALGVAVELREPHGSLESERDRHGVLAVRATGHGCMRVIARQRGERAPDGIEILDQECKAVAHLQDAAGVHDVLRRRAVVHETA